MISRARVTSRRWPGFRISLQIMAKIMRTHSKAVLPFLVLTLLLAAGCVLHGKQGDALLPEEVTPAMLEDKVVVLASMLTQDDRFEDELVLWNTETREKFFIKDATWIPLKGGRNLELSMFALALEPGTYVYSDYQNDIPYDVGGGLKTWTGFERIINRPLKAGELIYIGRFTCRPKTDGCVWYVTIEDAQDVPVLKALNPTLPWDKLQVSEKRHPR